ncbi:MAG: response regulator transcription factor [Bacteroidota bacterium]
MKYNILIVDDNARFIESFHTILMFYFSEKIENIYTASNAEECLNVLVKNKVEIVFMDFDMPEKNGEELTRIITEYYRYIKIIAVSFHKEHQVLSRMILAGARAYINKEEINRETLSRCFALDLG